MGDTKVQPRRLGSVHNSEDCHLIVAGRKRSFADDFPEQLLLPSLT